jgi:hypothetical protein
MWFVRAWLRAARDMRCTWPHVKITLLFFPWDWRLVLTRV